MQLRIPYMILNEINRALFDRAVLPQEPVDWESLCKMCMAQSVSGLFWAGLQKSSVPEKPGVIEHFCKRETQERYQYAHQLRALKHVTQMLEAERIPYILLKGSRMRQYYPDPATRTSCDIDILFDGDEALLHEKMQALGYKFTQDAGTTLNYFRDPVEFEMHRRLFDDHLEFHGFFEEVWKHSHPVKEGSCERVLTEEFFYVYMVAHMAKHFTRYGCGVRPVIDLYLYQQNKPRNFDYKAAKQQLKKLDLLGFEQRLLALASTWFETGSLSETDQQITDYIMGTGIYGDKRITQARELEAPEQAADARSKNLRSYIFPSVKVMRRLYPRLMKCSLMLPVAWCVRWCSVFTGKRKHGMSELHRYMSVDEKYVSHVMRMTQELHLQ